MTSLFLVFCPLTGFKVHLRHAQLLKKFPGSLHETTKNSNETYIFQGGTEARYHNYLTIYKNLRFSTLPWYDLQVYSDEENHLHREACKLLENGSDSNSESEMPAETIVDDAIQVRPMTLIPYFVENYQGKLESKHMLSQPLWPVTQVLLCYYI